MKNVSVESSSLIFVPYSTTVSSCPVRQAGIDWRFECVTLNDLSVQSKILLKLYVLIFYTWTQHRGPGVKLYGYCGRLWYRVVAHGRPAFSVLVFCRWSCLVMKFARYSVRLDRGNATAAKTKGEIVMNNFHRPATPVRVRYVGTHEHVRTSKHYGKQPNNRTQPSRSVLPVACSTVRLGDRYQECHELSTRPFLIFVWTQK